MNIYLLIILYILQYTKLLRLVRIFCKQVRNNNHFLELENIQDTTIGLKFHILFQWEQEPDAVGYNLQALDQSFDIVLDIGISKTAYIDDSTFTWNSNYYWRVRSIYLYGSHGEWSELSIFTTGESLPHANLDIDIYNDNYMVYCLSKYLLL